MKGGTCCAAASCANLSV